MSRGRKLIIVGLVLAVGLALAWPFRKTTTENRYDSVAQVPAFQPQLQQTQQQRVSPAVVDRVPAEQPQQLVSPAPHVVAKMTGMADSKKSVPARSSTTSFDLANHPALASLPEPRTVSPVTPPVPPAAQVQLTHPNSSAPSKPKYGHARPAYQTAEPDEVFDAAAQRPQEVRHVVQNSDTLEKLAKRYLGDEGRALEIFDLNRDILDNPHLLPIDAELRIPGDARLTLE